ncbi:MAG: SRPBCC domain-containing protein [Saprospiraceae bacterium]|nr:SRPBCC domain-containing protein [Saprospiraceae bacterium]
MKHSVIIFIFLAGTILANAQNGKANTTKKTFSRETSISVEINADPGIVWALLTNASDYPRWNSTITSIEGEIKLGNKIKLKSYLDPKRTFKLKVKEFVPNQKLSWGDGKGTRIYTIQKTSGNMLTFSMVEKIGGFMFPMYKKYIPPFDESFEKFAADIKKEAEARQGN